MNDWTSARREEGAEGRTEGRAEADQGARSAADPATRQSGGCLQGPLRGEAEVCAVSDGGLHSVKVINLRERDGYSYVIRPITLIFHTHVFVCLFFSLYVFGLGCSRKQL